jgi:hypothetical protein
MNKFRVAARVAAYMYSDGMSHDNPAMHKSIAELYAEHATPHKIDLSKVSSRYKYSADVDLVDVFIGVSWKPGSTTKEGAIERMKKIIEKMGYKVGEFYEEQDLGDSVVGNLEVEERFYDRHSQKGFEGRDDLVEVNMDVP